MNRIDSLPVCALEPGCRLSGPCALLRRVGRSGQGMIPLILLSCPISPFSAVPPSYGVTTIFM